MVGLLDSTSKAWNHLGLGKGNMAADVYRAGGCVESESPNTFSNWSCQPRARQPFLRGLSHQYKDVLSCYGVTKYQDTGNENATPPVLTFAPNSINTLLSIRTRVIQTLKPPAFDSLTFYVGTQFWKSGLNFLIQKWSIFRFDGGNYLLILFYKPARTLTTGGPKTFSASKYVFL